VEGERMEKRRTLGGVRTARKVGFTEERHNHDDASKRVFLTSMREGEREPSKSYKSLKAFSIKVH